MKTAGATGSIARIRTGLNRTRRRLRVRRLPFRHGNDRMAWGLPTWQSMRMPDYSLFGDEHVRQYEATGGKIGHDWNDTSCLVLHTIGRKSGETKKFPLIYGRDGNNYLIVASKQELRPEPRFRCRPQ